MDAVEQGGLLADGGQFGLCVIEGPQGVLDGPRTGNGEKLVDALLVMGETAVGPGFEVPCAGFLTGEGRPWYGWEFSVPEIAVSWVATASRLIRTTPAAI
jgi:hypothetical protein